MFDLAELERAHAVVGAAVSQPGRGLLVDLAPQRVPQQRVRLEREAQRVPRGFVHLRHHGLPGLHAYHQLARQRRRELDLRAGGSSPSEVTTANQPAQIKWRSIPPTPAQPGISPSSNREAIARRLHFFLADV